MFHEMISHIQGSLDAQNGYKYYLHSEYLSSPLHTFLFPELQKRLYGGFTPLSQARVVHVKVLLLCLLLFIL